MTDYSIVAQQGRFGLNGRPAVLNRGLRLTAANGAFVLTGEALTFYTGVGHPLVALVGSFTLTGEALTFRKACTIVAGTGTFGLHGFSLAVARRWQALARTISPVAVARTAASALAVVRTAASKLSRI